MPTLSTQLGVLNGSFFAAIRNGNRNHILNTYSSAYFNHLLRKGELTAETVQVVKAKTDDFSLEARVFNYEPSPTGDATDFDNTGACIPTDDVKAREPIVYLDEIVLKVMDFNSANPGDWLKKVKAAVKEKLIGIYQFDGGLSTKNKAVFAQPYTDKGRSRINIIEISDDGTIKNYHIDAELKTPKQQKESKPMVICYTESRLEAHLAALAGLLGPLEEKVDDKTSLPVSPQSSEYSGKNQAFRNKAAASLKDLSSLLDAMQPTKEFNIRTTDRYSETAKLPYFVRLDIRRKGYARVTEHGRFVYTVPVYELNSINVGYNFVPFGMIFEENGIKPQDRQVENVKAFMQTFTDMARAENEGMLIETEDKDADSNNDSNGADIPSMRYSSDRVFPIEPCIASTGSEIDVSFNADIKKMLGFDSKINIQHPMLLTGNQIWLLAYNMMYALDRSLKMDKPLGMQGQRLLPHISK